MLNHLPGKTLANVNRVVKGDFSEEIEIFVKELPEPFVFTLNDDCCKPVLSHFPDDDFIDVWCGEKILFVEVTYEENHSCYLKLGFELGALVFIYKGESESD